MDIRRERRSGLTHMLHIILYILVYFKYVVNIANNKSMNCPYFSKCGRIRLLFS